MGNYAGRKIKETKPGNQMTHDNDRGAAEFPLFTLNFVFMDGTQDEGGGSARYKRKMPAQSTRKSALFSVSSFVLQLKAIL